MADQFKEVEETFLRLKERFSERKISQRHFIDSLKQLRIKDDEGRFWMIGAQTGRWYFFDGSDWIQAAPPSLEERKVICIYCGFENDLEAEVCAKCGSEPAAEEPEKICSQCGAKRDDPYRPCPFCESEKIEERPFPPLSLKSIGTPSGDADFLIRSVHRASFFWFFGALGLFISMVLGLLAGATSLFPGLGGALPGFFRDMQGTLLGGIVFTIVGGVFGFVICAGGGYLFAMLVNGILSFMGGIKIGADRLERKRKEE